MHPLIAAHLRLQGLRDIEPRCMGLYWPMWATWFDDEVAFITELSK